MQICQQKSSMRQARLVWGRASVGFVPTMGALHQGHLALIHAARQECRYVVVSIFVNPLQFAQGEDFDVYPHSLEQDITMLRNAGVDVLFCPNATEMYANSTVRGQTIVDHTHLSAILIGRMRKGHFRGVCTVVAKLFNIVCPDKAYFGEKDYQQMMIIKRIVADLDFGVDVVSVPTVRDKDGLALSSRNALLAEHDRRAAPILARSLDAAEEFVKTGHNNQRPFTATALVQVIRECLAKEPRATIQSIDVRCAKTLASVQGFVKQPVVALLSVRLGRVVLIDQRVLG